MHYYINKDLPWLVAKNKKKPLHNPIYHIKAAKLKIHDDNKFYSILFYLCYFYYNIVKK